MIPKNKTMKKLKIAHLAPCSTILPPKGDQGRWILAANLIKEQIKQGHDITIFSNKKTSLKKCKNVYIEPLKPIDDQAKTKEKIRNINNLLLIQKAYSLSQKFDIIHSHYNELHFFFSHLLKTPTIVTQHWPIDLETLKIIKQTPQNNLYVTPISNSQKKQGKNYLKYTKTVYNGLNLSNFKYNPSPKDHLVYISRMVPEKGADIACKIAIETGQRLLLIGKTNNSSKYKNYFNKKIKPYLKNPLIKYLGEKPYKEIDKHFGQARAFLFPLQWEEPFGLVMIDAMATGTPVIAFNRGAVPEVVKNGKTGFVVNTQQQMKQAVQKIDTIKRADCRKRVEKYFSVPAMAKGYEQVYKKILKIK